MISPWIRFGYGRRLPCESDVKKTVGLLLLVLQSATKGEAEPAIVFPDPAPPKVYPKPAVLGVPLPRTHAALRRYRNPRPLSPDAAARDWPQFLGPYRDGTTPGTHLLDSLDPPRGEAADPLMVWATLRGESYAAPSIQGNRVVHFHRVRDDEVVDCLNAGTGKRYWVAGYPTTYRDRFNYLNGPRATPAIDGNRVYTLGAQGVLQSLDLTTGHLFWRRQIAEEFEINEGFFGFSTSPLIDGDLLIVNLGLGKCVAAFDKQNGALRWLSGTQWGRSYATPVAATVHGRRVLFVFAGGMTKPPVGGLLCLEPASGSVHFRFPWRSPRQFSANASSPVVSGNRIFISTSYDIHGAMLEVKPDMTFYVVYKTRAYSSHWATPILHDGCLYGFANNKLTCMRWATGERMWRRTLRLGDSGRGDLVEEDELPAGASGAERYRLPPGTTGFGIGSLIRADGRFLCLGETGLLAWLDLSSEGCRILSGRRLFSAEQTWTAPVLSRGLLYVVQNLPGGGDPPRLLCYDLRGE